MLAMSVMTSSRRCSCPAVVANGQCECLHPSIHPCVRTYIHAYLQTYGYIDSGPVANAPRRLNMLVLTPAPLTGVSRRESFAVRGRDDEPLIHAIFSDDSLAKIRRPNVGEKKKWTNTDVCMFVAMFTLSNSSIV